MAIMTISSKGQMVLPVDVRRRFGLMAGAKIEIIEEKDGLKLVAVHAVKSKSIAKLTSCFEYVTNNTNPCYLLK